MSRTFSLLLLAAIVTFVCGVMVHTSRTLSAADIYATITTGLFVPQSPNNLAVSIDDRGVDLSWSPPLLSGGVAVTDYIIEYQLSSGGVWSVYPDGVSTDTFASLTGLTNDTSYDFRVSAVNGVGQGPASTEVSATPGVPAQVLITSLSDLTVPSITAETRITNEGGEAYEYQYTWCVTNAEANLCGGGDDIFTAMGAKLIQPGENWDTSLTATVGSTGNYWFHLAVAFGSDSSYARQSFTAATAPSSGGGSGGGSKAKSRACVGADMNRDRMVNLVDFSILLIFFNALPPFSNACVDINRDGKANVIDFSILLTQWERKPIPYSLTP